MNPIKDEIVDLDEEIASANELLASLRETMESVTITRVRRSSALTTMQRAQPIASPEVQITPNQIDEALQNIQTEARANEPSNNTASEHSRRPNQTPIEIIDLCTNTPEVIDLVSPARSRRRDRRFTPLAGIPFFIEEHTPATSHAEVSIFPVSTSTVTRGPPKQPHTENPMICAICLDSYGNRNPMVTKCGHIFCKNCILQSLQSSRLCPICKTMVSARNLLKIYF